MKQRLVIIIAAIAFIVGGVIAAAISTNGFDSSGGETVLQPENTLEKTQKESEALQTAPVKATENEAQAPAYNTVNILGEEYDIAATTDLYLDFNEITDDILKEIAPEIKKLSNLDRLTLIGNEITDTLPLAELTDLKELNLYRNKITNITPLAMLTGLTKLNLDSNQIEDISVLAQLTNLTELDLGFNRFTDISPLAQLTNLIHLSVTNNQVTDISPLMQLDNLRILYLQPNPVIDQDIESLKSKLPHCSLSTY